MVGGETVKIIRKKLFRYLRTPQVFKRYLFFSSEKAMASHSSPLAWKIPWMEGPGGLQSTRSRTRLSNFTFTFHFSCTGEGNGNPVQCSCLENLRDCGVYGVAQSRTRLKRLSSSSSSSILLLLNHKQDKYLKRL